MKNHAVTDEDHFAARDREMQELDNRLRAIEEGTDDPELDTLEEPEPTGINRRRITRNGRQIQGQVSRGQP